MIGTISVVLDEAGEGVVCPAVKLYLFLKGLVLHDVVNLGGHQRYPIIEAPFTDLHHRICRV